jgi:hypothetical protein
VRPAICMEIHPPSMARYGATVESIVKLLHKYDYRLARNLTTVIGVDEIKAAIGSHGYVDVLFLPMNV